MAVGGELLIIRCEVVAQPDRLAGGQRPVAPILRPERQQRLFGVFVRDVVDDLVEGVVVGQRHVVEGQQPCRLLVVFGVEVEQEFQHGGREFEVVDQKVVDGRTVEEVQRRLRIGMLPFEDHLLVVGNQIGEVLEGVETEVAGFVHRTAPLRFVRQAEGAGEIVVAPSFDPECLVGGGVKDCFGHCGGVLTE